MAERLALTKFEVFTAASEAVRRQMQRQDHDPLSWGPAIEQACAELVFAKYLGRYWDPFSSPWVGGFWVCHSLSHEDSLLIRNEWPKGKRLVFITGNGMDGFQLQGWCFSDAWRIEQFQKDEGWLVHPRHLDRGFDVYRQPRD